MKQTGVYAGKGTTFNCGSIWDRPHGFKQQIEGGWLRWLRHGRYWIYHVYEDYKEHTQK